MSNFTIETSDYIDWTFDYDIFFTFEVETSAVETVLPGRLRPFEARPGVSLVSCSVHHFSRNNLGKLPDFNEANVNVLVQPDLSIEMPHPKFAFYIVNVVSDCEPFLAHANEVDKMPTYHSPSLRCVVSEDGQSVSVKDDDGLLFECKSTYEGTPSFVNETIYGQGFSQIEGEDYNINFRWTGELIEHQRKGNAGQIYNHPSLGKLELPTEPMTCYLQMVGPRNQKNGQLRYYTPVKW